VETHLLDFGEDIYGVALKVEFFSRLRDEIAFETPDQLVQQIQKDVESARQILEVS